MNKVLLTGRLTADVKVNEYGKGETAGILAPFTVAVQTNKEEATFVNCVAFNNQAEFLDKWFKKGSPIEVEGRLTNDNYKDINGDMRYTYKVVVERLGFLPSTSEEKPAEEKTTKKYRR